MPSSFDKYFSAEDLKRIEEAVKTAEQETSGEIVPYVVHMSDTYDEAMWRAGAALGACALTVFVLFHNFSASWQPFEMMHLAFVTLGAGAIGALLARFSEPVRRLFAGRDVMDKRARQRAAEAFITEEVFDTRDRTGILIFLSLLEHEVVILGDSGINAKVKQEEWDGIVKTIVDGIRSEKTAEGLIDAIRQCGELLKREGVARKQDDSDELPNALRRSTT